MNFAALKEFRKLPDSGIKQVVDYLSTEMSATLRELRVGLQRLTFVDNFDSFEAIITIAPATEATVTNQLRAIPTGYIILRKDKGGLSVCDGDAPWTLSTLTLKNTSATDTANVKVRFFK